MSFLPTLPVFAAYVAAVLVISNAAMLGATTGILIHTTLVALGLSALLAASAMAFLVLKMVGAIYLLWLAVEAIRHGSALNIDASKPASAGEPLIRVWAKGLGVNLLNPKVIMFFVTFLPQFVAADDPHAAKKLVFLGAVFVAVSLPICLSMIVFAARLAKLLRRSPSVMRGVDYLFAGIFGAFAVRLLMTQRH
jgi:threonine/homoserine/homoserine lactone efflux protein